MVLENAAVCYYLQKHIQKTMYYSNHAHGEKQLIILLGEKKKMKLLNNLIIQPLYKKRSKPKQGMQLNAILNLLFD